MGPKYADGGERDLEPRFGGNCENLSNLVLRLSDQPLPNQPGAEPGSQLRAASPVLQTSICGWFLASQLWGSIKESKTACVASLCPQDTPLDDRSSIWFYHVAVGHTCKCHCGQSRNQLVWRQFPCYCGPYLKPEYPQTSPILRDTIRSWARPPQYYKNAGHYSPRDTPTYPSKKG